MAKLRPVLFAVAAVMASCAPAPSAGFWPQWRGPNRDNISTETELLLEWPDGGPPLEWEIEGIGEGISGPVVAGGRVFVTGFHGDDEVLTVLDEGTGRRLWTAPVGSTRGKVDHPLMRWLMQRAPTVDEDRVYVCSGDARLTCLLVTDGRELWSRGYVEHFGEKPSPWGHCDYPLVDGEKLLCVVGGDEPAMVAVEKKTGRLIWRSATPRQAVDTAWAGEWGATVVTEAGGIRQYVSYMRHGLFGFRASDGKILWSRVEDLENAHYSSQTPIVQTDSVISTAGYVGPLMRLTLHSSPEGIAVTEEFVVRKGAMSLVQDSTVVMDSRLLGLQIPARLICVDARTGKVQWGRRLTDREASSLTVADNRLWIHGAGGVVTLVEPAPTGPVEKASFKLPGPKVSSGAAMPVIAGGRLYLRRENVLYRYDVRKRSSLGPGSVPQRIVLSVPSRPPPGTTQTVRRAAFVPTPQSVVEKMLRLADVSDKDVVCDLGSGDGRVLLTAAKSYGARAIGYEIDAELVRSSRKQVEAQGLQGLISVEERDMFTADLSQVTVVAVYLPEEFLARLLPQFRTMKPGARIVSHQFRLPGIQPKGKQAIQSGEDGLEHEILLYQTPLASEADKK